jgi:hypothetical protein
MTFLALASIFSSSNLRSTPRDLARIGVLASALRKVEPKIFDMASAMLSSVFFFDVSSGSQNQTGGGGK